MSLGTDLEIQLRYRVLYRPVRVTTGVQTGRCSFYQKPIPSEAVVGCQCEANIVFYLVFSHQTKTKPNRPDLPCCPAGPVRTALLLISYKFMKVSTLLCAGIEAKSAVIE